MNDSCPACGAPSLHPHEDDCWALRAFETAPWLDPYGPNPLIIDQLIDRGRVEP